MSRSIQLLLGAHLHTEASTIACLPDALRLLTVESLVVRAEREGAEQAAAIVHKWVLRLSSLINGQRDSLGRPAGFALALETSRQSEAIFLGHGKAWTSSAMAALSYATGTARLHQVAVGFLAFAVSEARRLPEFAREVFKPDSLKQLARDLCAVASTPSADLAVRIQALDLLAVLFELHAVTLRPIAHPSPTGMDKAPSIQDVLISLLCQDDTAPVLSETVARTFAHLWLTAGKKDGASRWRQTTEAVIGSMHVSLTAVARTFVEDFEVSPPAPLNLPQVVPHIAPGSNFAGACDTMRASMRRLATLERILLALLCTATERPVAVPVGALNQLLLRCFALSPDAKAREVADPDLRPAELANLFELHLFGARLLAQLTSVLGPHLAPYTPRLLAFLCHLLHAYPANSPTKASLLSSCTLLADAAPLEPHDGARHLSTILQAVLAGLAPLITKPEAPMKPSVNGHDSTRKAKRAKFEVDQAFAHRVPVSRQALAIAQQSLISLGRLLDSAAAPFFPPNQLNLALRLLLALTTHPCFSNVYTSTSVHAPDSLTFALAARPSLRPALLRSLVSAIALAGRDAAGLLERAVGVLHAATASADGETREIAARGLAAVELIVHPGVPPLTLSATLRRAVVEAVGGEVSLAEADEEPPAVMESQETDMAPSSPAAAPAPVLVSTDIDVDTAGTMPIAPAVATTSNLFAAPFALPAPAPTFALPSAESVATPPIATSVTDSAIAVTAKVAPPVARPLDLVSDDDDEPMPTIDLGWSDDDEEMAPREADERT